MKTSIWLVVLALILVAAGASYVWKGPAPGGKAAPLSLPNASYRSEPMARGDIRNVVSATGTLAAVDDVVVGAQLSGQITEVLADFNDTVSAGQLLARIDPRTFASKVAQQQAQLDRYAADIALQQIAIEQAEVNLAQAKRTYTRAKALVASKNISQDELDDYQTAVELQTLAVAQSKAQLAVLEADRATGKAALAQAQIELDRTEIRSPIDGFVIDRTIEAGQTVASSLNTPELFTLARDLSEMEIQAYIDESDIGQIALQQRVRFAVDAYPDAHFFGQVKQIRRAPQTNSGVISYTVVISAKNPEGRLLPGMTANLEISIDSLQDTQRVSNAALRTAQRHLQSQQGARQGPMTYLQQLGLSDAQQQALRERMPKPGGFGPGVDEQNKRRMQQAVEQILTAEQKALLADLKSGKLKMGTLLLVRDGRIEPVSVQLGISDDQYTAVLSPDLTGAEVITQLRTQQP